MALAANMMAMKMASRLDAGMASTFASNQQNSGFNRAIPQCSTRPIRANSLGLAAGYRGQRKLKNARFIGRKGYHMEGNGANH